MAKMLKTLWDVRAKTQTDDVYRVHCTAVPWLRAIRTVIRYSKKYDEVTIRKSKVYGRKRI